MADDNEVYGLRDALKNALDKLSRRSALLNKIIFYQDIDTVGLSLLDVDHKELKAFKEDYEKESTALNGCKASKL